MEKELIVKDKIKNKVFIQHDDLMYDGNKITIPGYYVDIILDYVKDWKIDDVPLVDIQDYQSFRNFLFDVQNFKIKNKNKL